MNKIKTLIGAALLSLILVGCASSGNQFLKKETNESISQKLQQNVTTKDQVSKLFGPPAETSFTDSGKEIWSYQLRDVSSDAINFVPIVNLFGSSYSGTQTSLKIIFNNNNTVQKYSFSKSDVDTKTGLFK